MNAADVEAAADNIWRSGKKPTVGRIAAFLEVSPVELVERFLDPRSEASAQMAALSEVARHAAALKVDWQSLIWDDTDIDDLPVQPETRSSARQLPSPAKKPTATSVPRFLTEPGRPARTDLTRRHNAGASVSRAAQRARRHANTA